MMKFRIVLLLMIINGALIAPLKAAAAEQAEEEEKVQGIVPSGDPALAQEMQEREWAGPARGQEIQRVLTTRLAPRLINIIAGYDDWNPWFDPTVEVTERVRRGNITPDGRWLLNRDRYRIWRVRDVQTGNEVQVLQGYTAQSIKVSTSQDGRWLVTITAYDEMVRIWDMKTGEVQVLDAQCRVLAVAISPDGKRIVTGCNDGSVRVWDRQTGKAQLILPGNEEGLTRIAISLNGKRIVTAFRNTVRIWDMNAIVNAADYDSSLLGTLDHTDNVNAVAISPDGKQVVTGSGNTIRIWDVQTGELVRKIDLSSFVLSVAISPSGTWMVAGLVNGTAQIMNLSNGDIGRALKHEDRVDTVAISPDGATVITRADGKVRVWSLIRLPKEPEDQPRKCRNCVIL